jgi:hypothetical protein
VKNSNRNQIVRPVFGAIIGLSLMATPTIQTPAQAGSESTLPLSARASENQSHDLSWITTRNDFPQIKEDNVAIEMRLRNLITSQSTIYELELPINQKRLSYLGYISAEKLEEFSALRSHIKSRDYLTKKAHYYVYDGIYISVPGDSRNDQQNVFYTIRAINILKYRYPDAFKKLVADARTFPLQGYQVAANATLGWLNSTPFLLISYNETPQFIAASETILSDVGIISGTKIQTFRNLSCISIHNTTINGTDEKRGSRLIYNLAEASNNYTHYMRDGLIETLVHELLHRNIDYLNSVDRQSGLIFNWDGRKPADSPKFNPDQFDLEEAVVQNTALSYFRKRGGISNEALNAEESRSNAILKDLTKKQVLASLTSQFTGEDNGGTDYKNLLILPVLN